MDNLAPPTLDLESCAAEPIRIPGAIQPHGALVVADPADLRIIQASANAGAWLGSTALGRPLAEIVGPSGAADIRAWHAAPTAPFLRTMLVEMTAMQVSAHSSPQGVILEFEATPASEAETLEAVYPRLRTFVDAIGAADSVLRIAQLTAQELKTLTGFNRIMVYSFDRQGDGTVIAEVGDGLLPSYLDLRFPASDIPSQARELYRTNRLRLIPDADYRPAAIEPAASPIDQRPLDLSAAALRSVSPIHLQYMRNMDTAASMSISVLFDGQLWGLISCHNQRPRLLNPQLRAACDFLGQIVSLQIGSRERATHASRRIALKKLETELLARLSRHADLHAGLRESGEVWTRVVAADGCAVLTADGLTCYGQTPSEPDIKELARRLHVDAAREIHATDHLSLEWPAAAAFASTASGLLAVSISQLHPSYIMWFRQEVVRTVRWSGDPRGDPAAGSLHPRKSFDQWKQQVRLQSLPWDEAAVEAATDVRNALINHVLRQAEERAALSEKLQRSNAELEAFSYSVSHDLRAPFRHIVGYSELLSNREKNLDDKSRHYVTSIVDSALHAGRLVDDLLAFSQMGRTSMAQQRVDMGKLVIEVRRSLAHEYSQRRVEWQVSELPPTSGDSSLLRQVWTNLLDNALKYSSGRDPAVIQIRGATLGGALEYSVTDNGVGFEMDYVGKLFGVFQRLHRTEDFAGTGIGLALVKRIIERHGGSVFAQGEVNKGATIGFTLPLPTQAPSHVRT